MLQGLIPSLGDGTGTSPDHRPSRPPPKSNGLFYIKATTSVYASPYDLSNSRKAIKVTRMCPYSPGGRRTNGICNTNPFWKHLSTRQITNYNTYKNYLQLVTSKHKRKWYIINSRLHSQYIIMSLSFQDFCHWRRTWLWLLRSVRLGLRRVDHRCYRWHLHRT